MWDAMRRVVVRTFGVRCAARRRQVVAWCESSRARGLRLSVESVFLQLARPVLLYLSLSLSLPYLLLSSRDDIDPPRPTARRDLSYTGSICPSKARESVSEWGCGCGNGPKH